MTPSYPDIERRLMKTPLRARSTNLLLVFRFEKIGCVGQAMTLSNSVGSSGARDADGAFIAPSRFEVLDQREGGCDLCVRIHVDGKTRKRRDLIAS